MLSVLILTKNEAGNIPDTIHRIAQAVSKIGERYEMLVLDSNSTDGTQSIVERLRDVYPVRVVDCCRLDLAESFVKGVAASTGGYILVTDGDGQHNIEEIPNMLMNMTDSDIVADGAHPKGLRAIPSVMARYLTKLFIPKLRNMEYPTSNFFMVKRKVIKNVDWNPAGFKPLLEILVKGNYKRVAFTSTHLNKRNEGKSKFSADIIIKHIVHLNRLRKYGG